jgi:hypothetical protein
MNIELTQGKTAIVNDEDYELLKGMNWSAVKGKTTYYAVCRTGEKKGIKKTYMHRLLLGVKDVKVQIDHKDHNGLNNQRDNLRVATHSENCSNVSSHKNSTSKFLGVTTYRSGKFRASIRKNRINYHIGYYATEKEAALAYNNEAVKLHGNFANLNKV